MKKSLTIIVFLCALVLFSFSTLNAQALKVGVFDIQKILRDSKKVQDYRIALEKEIAAKRKVLLEKQDAIVLIEEKLKKDGDKLKPEERVRLQDKHGNELKELKRLREDIDLELQKIDRELTRRAIAEISDVIKAMGDKENYSIIFEKTAAGVVYLKEVFDITQKITNAYDAKK
jgi:Skp family chaperone for outer membrane proteins